MRLLPGDCQCGCGRQTTIASRKDTAKGWIKGRPTRFVAGHQRRAAPSIRAGYRLRWAEEAPGVPYGRCQCGCGLRTRKAPKTSTTRGVVRGEPLRFRGGHWSRKSPILYVEEDRGYDTYCWIWQGAASDHGYGHVRRDGKLMQAHRVYYEAVHGTIPDGLHLDHLCRMPPCVNPDHLEPVTPAENTRRGLRARLTVKAAAEIRRLHQEEGMAALPLAHAFGVGCSTVHHVLKGNTWKEVRP